MKKRKELDALLSTNMANGKKNGKSKRAKEGHELLRLDSDSNSSDNDELFLAAPKKTVIRRPRTCQCCSMCVPLIMFILTMGCIVVTGGLIWMHFNLKNDLDDLRQKLEKVTIMADSAASQQNTIMDLESRLQAISDVPGKVDVAANNIAAQNSTFRSAIESLNSRLTEVEKLKGRVETLETHAPSTTTGELQQTVALNGNNIKDLQSKAEQQESAVAAQNVVLETIRADITTLQNQVAELQHPVATHSATTVPPLPQLPTTPKSSTAPHTNTGTGDGAHLIVLSKEIQDIWNAVHDINSTVVVLESEHIDLAGTVTALQKSLSNKTGLPVAPTTSPTQPTSPSLPTTESTSLHPVSRPANQTIEYYDLAQMKADIELLKLECNRSSGSAPPAVTSPQDPAGFNATWRQSIADRLGGLEARVNQLNPKDLNNNLLNANTTQGIQFLIERSLNNFRDENLADFSTLSGNVTALQTELALQDAFQDEVGIQITSLGNEVKSLQEDCAVCRQGEIPTDPPRRP